MSEKVEKFNIHKLLLKNQYLTVLGPVVFFHLLILSITVAPEIKFEIPLKNSDRTIRLDQFSLRKEDVKPLVFSTKPGPKATGGQKLDLSNLQIGNFGNLANQNVETKKENSTISDRVSEIKASDLKVGDDQNSVTLLERSAARELLLRHRKRLRTPEVQMDQEGKLDRINNQIGSSMPGRLSDFNFSIVPNSKLSKEELNSIEKKFYAFHVRLSEKYSGTISSQILRGMQVRPQLKHSLMEKHVLQAKIVYDKNGEIVLTKILRSSDYKDVHLTFEDILANFGLPNVPKELLDDDEQFTVYFTLAIN